MAQPSPSKLMFVIDPSSTSRYTVTWSPHRGLVPSACRLALGRRAKLRGLRWWSRITSWYRSSRGFMRWNILWASPRQETEVVDFLALVVEGQRHARGAGHAHALHGGLRAVVAGADGDAVAVEDGAEVVRVDAVEHEGDGGGALLGPADQAHARARGRAPPRRRRAAPPRSARWPPCPATRRSRWPRPGRWRPGCAGVPASNLAGGGA